jgi:hypothetical protein
MAVNFPSNPTNGQTITASGITYAYDSTQGVWSDSPQGLTQAIDALTDVDTSTSAPTNGQTLQWNSTDSEWQPADSSAGVTVYATIDDLPVTGIAEGSMALVDSTDKLYIFSDAGWYSISIVNTTPSISGVSTAYTLATDGTATTITVSATDPEGLPLTYSIVSDTSGNVATVTQGTGSNTNQWTITPTTNTANGGNFTLVFRASDGVNIASASSTFNLHFVLTIPDSQYTTALITSVGANNAVNNSFDDASTNNHTITVNGNVTQTTFSPYRDGGYSTYFDGSGDYLTVTGSQRLDFGTGNFCVELWWWAATVTGNNSGLHIILSAPQATTTQIGFDEGSRKLYFYNNDYGGNIIQNTNATPTVRTWNHIALCRSGTTVSLYLNGTRVGTATHSSNVSFSGLEIGRYHGGGYEIDGYVRDVRLVKGSSIYDATQTSLTVPTEPLTAVTNTTFLGCHLPYIADGSATPHSINIIGTPKPEPFAPYERTEYDAYEHGGSMYFDGNDKLSLTSTSLNLGSNDFCIEAWVYTTTTSQQVIVGSLRWSDGVGAYMLSINYNSNKIRFFMRHGGGAVQDAQFEAGTFPTNQWVHVAVTRNGSNIRAFINGTQAGSTNTALGTDAIDNAQNNYYVGDNSDGNAYWSGYISDLRVVKGSPVYTADFDPPTTALTATTNTSLLLSGTNAGIIDKSQSNKTITLNGDVKSSTTQTKYLSSSMYFDGSDRINVGTLNGNRGRFAMSIEDFTWETWANLGFGMSGYHHMISSRPSNVGGAQQGGLSINPSGGVTFYAGAWVINYTTSIGTGSWRHIALARDGTTIRLYIDGTQVAINTNYTSDLSRDDLTIGANYDGSEAFLGYLSDVRITKGLARYTALDETANIPSAALEG